MVELRLDGERLLRCIETIEKQLNEIRRMSAMGAAPPSSPQGVDLTKIDWRDRNNDEVGTGEPWAWAFGYNQDGTYNPESETLVKAIERDGEVVMDGYEMTLSGRDNRLLNRKKLK